MTENTLPPISIVEKQPEDKAVTQFQAIMELEDGTVIVGSSYLPNAWQQEENVAVAIRYLRESARLQVLYAYREHKRLCDDD